MIEAKNSIKCMDNFRSISPHIAKYVYAPKVYWNLTTSKLLVMEFIDGVQVNDCRAIQKLGIQPSDVSTLVSLYTPFMKFSMMMPKKVRWIKLFHWKIFFSLSKVLQYICL